MTRHEFRRAVNALRRSHTERETLVLALTNLRRQYLASRMPRGFVRDYRDASVWAQAASK